MFTHNLTKVTMAMRSFSVAAQSAEAAPKSLKGVTGLDRKLTKAGLPIPPKRPGAAFIMFFKEELSKRPIPTEGSAKFSVSNLAKELSTRWKALPAEQVERYNQISAEAKKNYEKEYKVYTSTLTAQQLDQVSKIMGTSFRPPGGRKAIKRDLQSKSGSPPKPLTAFFLYRLKLNKDENLSQRMKSIQDGQQISIEVAKRWAALSDEEKKPFFDEALRQREAYAAWKKQNATPSSE